MFHDFHVEHLEKNYEKFLNLVEIAHKEVLLLFLSLLKIF